MIVLVRFAVPERGLVELDAFSRRPAEHHCAESTISDWKGFLQPELYTYSVVWLLLGIALLVVGYRFRAKSLRIASAVLVLIAVVKVFLIDMAHLEGLFRVLSFIGLGIALIGIGRFYQTILTGLNKDAPKEDIAPPSSPITAEESGR